MTGYRFYLEHKSKAKKRKNEHMGTVIAIDTNILDKYHVYEGLTAVFDTPNSDVCWSGASREYLRANCKRISEEKARAIHPALFKRLDS